MKTLKCILYAAILSLALVSCRKPVEISFDKNAQEIGPQGGKIEIALTSNGDWVVEPTLDWMTLSPMSGKGDANLSLIVAPNPGTESRTGTITASTKDNTATFTVTQSFTIPPEVESFLTIAPDTIECNHLGGNFEVEVMSNVEWQLEALPDWITASIVSGSNNGNITLTIAPNEDGDENREATVVVSSDSLLASLQVRQTYVPVVEYFFSVTPKDIYVDYEGGTETLHVISNINWSATTEADWITFSPASGDGDAEVVINVAENEELENREAYILFTYTLPDGSSNSDNVRVRQNEAPDPHFLTVTPLQFDFTHEGGQVEVTVACDTDWEVDLPSNWISASPDHGTGNGSFILTVEANDAVTERSTGIPVSSGELKEIIFVHQDGVSIEPEINFLVDTLFISPEGEVQTLYITSNIPWHLSSPSWITLTITNGEGDGYTGVIVEKNPTSTERIGVIYASYNEQIMNQIVVYQPGRVPYLETNTTEINATDEGGTFIVEVTSNQAWLVSKGAAWLQYTPINGIGNGQIEIHIDEQPFPRPRTAEIYVTGAEAGEIRIKVEQSN